MKSKVDVWNFLSFGWNFRSSKKTESTKNVWSANSPKNTLVPDLGTHNFKTWEPLLLGFWIPDLGFRGHPQVDIIGKV